MTTIVGLIMAIIVACVEKLHSPTLANTIIVAITVTIYTLGVILYMCLHEFKYDIISVVVAAVLAIPSIVLSFRVIVLTPYFFKLYDLTKDYTLYYLLSVFLFEIVCSCSLMLFSFTPIDPLSCENKTVSN
ncbi:hypothetical protein KSF78_0008016 [Schistosoma japonicum]|nr:hypothetical protein KSF78_0008016 [Schistosoma japonicum]